MITQSSKDDETEKPPSSLKKNQTPQKRKNL